MNIDLDGLRAAQAALLAAYPDCTVSCGFTEWKYHASMGLAPSYDRPEYTACVLGSWDESACKHSKIATASVPTPQELLAKIVEDFRKTTTPEEVPE